MTQPEHWVWVPFVVDKQYGGWRIDRFLSHRLAGYSRQKIQGILLSARVLKEERPAKASTKVRSGETVKIAYLRKLEAPLAPEATIAVVYEDDDLLVVNKPGDLLSHPTDKIVDHTVLGLLRHARRDLGKLHLLHRLDRETSGVIALAKNPLAARHWTRHMEAHRIQKEYIAIVRGTPSPREGTIDFPIGREGGEIRIRQWVNVPNAVTAITKYSVISNFRGQSPISIVRVFPKTGRLHQIRVHLAAIGNPILGDPLYTGTGEIYLKMTQGSATAEDRASLGFPRVALHAAVLTFPHPTSGKMLRVEAPLPDDMDSMISDKLIPR